MSDSQAHEREANENPAHWEAVEEATELLHEERYVEALRHLKEALERDGTNGYAYYFSGVALFECGEVQPARDAYRACIRTYPKHLGARIGLSHAERLLGNTREAIKEGLVALELAPHDGDALYAIGLAYHARGETTSARRYLQAFLETNPEYEVRSEVTDLLQHLSESSNDVS
jgi:tetratricopeptide (TPR) repeat protein